jgi:hypothetical protein
MYKVNGKVTFGAGAPGMIEYWRIDDTESTVSFALAINQPFVMVSDCGLSQERSYQIAKFLADMLNRFKEQAPPDLQVLPGGLRAAPGMIPGNPPPNPVVQPPPVEMPPLVEKDAQRFLSHGLGGVREASKGAMPVNVVQGADT